MNQKNRIWQNCLLIIIALNSMLLIGCRYTRFEDGNGKSITYINTMFDTKAGKITLESPEGSKVYIENLDSTSKALEVLSQTLNKIPSAP